MDASDPSQIAEALCTTLAALQELITRFRGLVKPSTPAGPRKGGRRAGVWYRRSRNMWYCTGRNKTQIPLGVYGEENREAAEAERRGLLQTAKLSPLTTPAVPVDPSETVSRLVRDFLVARRPRVSAGTWSQYDYCLRISFLPAFGHRAVTTLVPDELEAWADRPDWSNSTRHGRLGTVMTFLKWAKHPLKVTRPPMESRGAEAVITDEQFAAVVAAARGERYGTDLAALLTVLRETGARPAEVAGLTVASVDWGNQSVRLREHKTKRHGGDRVIHFGPPAMEVLNRQRAKYDSGHLFRTRHGRPWESAQLVKRMVQVSEKCGIHATAYGLGRHSFATKALSSGIPTAVVAALLGHRGTGMLERHYSHVGDNARVLKDAVEKLGRALSAPANGREQEEHAPS